jgi:glycine/D-amino acid oxidase-like deaminating enzyme
MTGLGGAGDAVVVGGGILGAATAAFLADAGLAVVLVERDTIASGASGRNSGVIQHPYDAARMPPSQSGGGASGRPSTGASASGSPSVSASMAPPSSSAQLTQ